MKELFNSRFSKLGLLPLPEFEGIRIMMMPVDFKFPHLIPPYLKSWQQTLIHLIDHTGLAKGIGYLTIDEMELKAGQIQRRPGLHVDGGKDAGWGGGGGGSGWGAKGMLCVSNVVGCQAWNQNGLYGEIGPENNCDHLRNQLEEDKRSLLVPNMLYWMDSMCIHESIPVSKDCRRQFVRLSYPNECPWFEGYTENPFVTAPGNVLPKRAYMGYQQSAAQ